MTLAVQRYQAENGIIKVNNAFILLDAFLIAPFRLPGSALAGMLLGTACLCVLCVLIGELSATGLFLANRRYHTGLRKNMVDKHNSSVNAIQAGDKDSFLAINRLAHESFGKYFFAQAAIGTASLWPLPFALGWMSERFEGLELFPLPFTDRQAGYVFLCILMYIVLRLAFSRIKRHLPLFSFIHAMNEESKRLSGTMRSFGG